MDYEDFLPNKEEYSEPELTEPKNVNKIGEMQVYNIITGKQPDWQTIIYELIHTEQLDPWDIDIVKLTNSYVARMHEIEEKSGPDFYLSSRVLLAASLLLRIKSEFLLNKYLRSIDEILFGKKDEEKKTIETIKIDEDEIPLLIPKTPLPRARKVTLQELMTALNKAINTESRRIKREVAVKRAKKLSEVDFPTFKKIELKDRIKLFYDNVLAKLKVPNSLNKVTYAELIGTEKDQKIASFLPMLHLSNTQKLWLAQEKHLDDIWVYLYEYFNKNRGLFFDDLEKEAEKIEEELKDLETNEKIEEISGFDGDH
jgi:segregation and condensation protein A